MLTGYKVIIVGAVIVLLLLAFTILLLLLMRGVSQSRPDWYQEQLDEEQMRAVSQMLKKKE